MWCWVLICVSNKQHYLSVKAREGRREAPYNYAPKPTHPFYFLLSRDRFNVLHNARPRYLLPCCMYFNKNVSTSSNMVFQFMRKKMDCFDILCPNSHPVPLALLQKGEAAYWWYFCTILILFCMFYSSWVESCFHFLDMPDLTEN